MVVGLWCYFDWVFEKEFFLFLFLSYSSYLELEYFDLFFFPSDSSYLELEYFDLFFFPSDSSYHELDELYFFDQQYLYFFFLSIHEHDRELKKN